MQRAGKRQWQSNEDSLCFMHTANSAIFISSLLSLLSFPLYAGEPESTSFIPRCIDSAVKADSPLSAIDLNGDNLLDIIVAYKGDLHKAVWYENTGIDETPYILHEMAVNDRYIVLPAKIDQDEYPDLVTAFECYALQWRKNDGTPVPDFADIHLISDNDYCFRPLIAADLDSDTDIDILTPYSWFENRGTLSTTFTKRLLDPQAFSVQKFFEAGDLDGDGDVDILIDDLQLKWLENQKGDPLTFVYHLVPTGIDNGYMVNGAEAQDFDNDGDIDLISTRTETLTQIDWFENDGQGNFTRHNIDMKGGNALAIADFDGDGDIDLIDATNNDLGWYETSATPQDASHPITFVRHPIDTNTFKSLCAADMDNDGDTDFLAGSETALYIYENLIIQNTPTPTPTPPSVPTPTPQPTVNPAQLDLNHDGIIDSLDLLLFQTHWHETSYEP